MGTDADDTIGIQLAGGILTDIGDVVGQLLHAALGVADLKIVLIDVDGGEEVLADKALIDDDGVLVVVPLPRHISGEDITSQGELTTLSGEALGEDLSGSDAIALHDDRALIDGGTLVRPAPLGEVVLGHLVSEADKLLVLGVVVADADRIGIDILDHAIPLGHHLRAAIAHHRSLETSAYDRRLSVEERHSLAHHVTTHEGTVRIIVIKEGDQCGSDGADLHRRYVDEVYILGIHDREV